jgi:hypothetical protein
LGCKIIIEVPLADLIKGERLKMGLPLCSKLCPPLSNLIDSMTYKRGAKNENVAQAIFKI